VARIAVLGSANMDLVAYVPVAPARGETVTGREFRTIPGGKGANQAVAAARAGAEVTFLGAVGSDAFGEQIRATLAAEGIDVSRLRTVEGPTGTAHIVVDDEGGNSIVVVPSANGTVTSITEEDRAAIAAADALLLQLETPLEGVIAGARAAKEAGVPVILTPAPVQPLPADLLGAVQLLVPNEHEAKPIGGDLAGLLELVPEALITLGAAGCVYGRRGEEPIEVSGQEVDAVDTTAAGDTFVGALAVARAEGLETIAALRWATVAAALSVQRVGATSSMPSRAEIEVAYSGR
jgi:ribokinase